MNMFAKNSSEEEKEILKDVIGSLSKKGQEVIYAMLNGYTQSEAAHTTGLSQPVVSYYIKMFRARAVKALGNS